MKTYVDIETTGFSPRSDRVTRISAIRLNRDGSFDVYDQMVDPGRDIPPEVQQLTGLTPALLSNFPSLEEVRDDWLEFSSQSALISYGDFENRFMPPHGLALKCFSALSKVRKRVKEDRVVSPMPDFRLETVASRLGLRHRPHDSLSDATVLANICRILGADPV